MKTNQIIVGGKSYPCRVTMGAMVRFQQETGKDVSAMERNNVGELVHFVYYCIVSACHADNIDFPYDFITFADLLEPDCINSFYQDVRQTAVSNNEDSNEKKTAPKPA